MSSYQLVPKYLDPSITFYILYDNASTNSFSTTVSLQFCFSLFVSIYLCSSELLCVSCLYPAHSVLSNLYYIFLMFLFISIGYHLLLNVSLGPQLFSFPSCGLSLAWSLPYRCHLYMPPPNKHCLDELRGCACIPDSDCLHSYKGFVFFSLSVSAFEGQHSFVVSLACTAINEVSS